MTSLIAKLIVSLIHICKNSYQYIVSTLKHNIAVAVKIRIFENYFRLMDFLNI